jgi:hypothetical protein
MAFTTTWIASSTVIDGETIDIDSTPTLIDYGELPFGTKVAAAHRLSIDVNGTEGYKVLIFSRNDLINSNGSKIEPITGTNASPIAWSDGCTAGAAGCFGYHTTDPTLEGGSSRFAAPDTFARLSSTTAEEIFFNTSPTTGTTTDVVYKLQVEPIQDVGQYETNIVYIAIPIF